MEQCDFVSLQKFTDMKRDKYNYMYHAQTFSCDIEEKQIHGISHKVTTLLTKRSLLEYCEDMLKDGNSNIS